MATVKPFLAIPKCKYRRLVLQDIMMVVLLGDVMAQWLVRRTLDLKVESSSPGRRVYVVFLGEVLNSHSASLLYTRKNIIFSSESAPL